MVIDQSALSTLKFRDFVEAKITNKPLPQTINYFPVQRGAQQSWTTHASKADMVQSQAGPRPLWVRRAKAPSLWRAVGDRHQPKWHPQRRALAGGL